MKRWSLQTSGTLPTIPEKCELFEMARVGRANRAGFEVLGMIFGWPDRAISRGAPTVAICWKHSASTDLDPFCHHTTVF